MEMERRTGRLVVCAPAPRGVGRAAPPTRHAIARTAHARRGGIHKRRFFCTARASAVQVRRAPRPASSHLTRLTCSLKTLLETSLD